MTARVLRSLLLCSLLATLLTAAAAACPGFVRHHVPGPSWDTYLFRDADGAPVDVVLVAEEISTNARVEVDTGVAWIAIAQGVPMVGRALRVSKGGGGTFKAGNGICQDEWSDPNDE